MVEDIFQIKNIEKKEKAVRFHYESAYRVKLKKEMTPHEIEALYRNLEKLRGTEFIYDKTKT
jgi:hypothetical protein